MEPSPTVDDLVHKRIEALDALHPQIVGVRVTLGAHDKRRVTGRQFDVHLHVHVPGNDLHLHRAFGREEAEDDLKRAVNACFTAAERQLKEDRRQKRPQDTKEHAPVQHGTVETLEPELGWGMARGEDGREVYFQRESLTQGAWEDIGKGDRLRYRAFDGEKGPFAVDVHRVD
jgi:cold shock CspA family protein/ribosome-associated translation inhibitor RaiA